MKIEDIGGEFGLIDRLTSREAVEGVKRGVGDDAAVIDYNEEYDLLVTTDMLVEDVHFRFDWSAPFQVGVKAMESNVSDIAAMGGFPRWAFVSLGLKRGGGVELADALYKGFNNSCKRNEFHIVGGDTTRSNRTTLSITMLGFVEKDQAVLRSNANPGDNVAVTGNLGKAEAGLQSFISGKVSSCRKDHSEPVSRLEWGRILRRYATSMIDVSDGLAGDVGHICQESGVGVVIDGDSIPISKEVSKFAESLRRSALKWALTGGEDFELVFTYHPDQEEDIRRSGVEFTNVGKTMKEKKRTLIIGEKRVSLKGGFDHFG